VPGLHGLVRGGSYLSLDTEGRVIRVDSFAKFMAPGLRLGWVAAQPRIIEKLTMTIQVGSWGRGREERARMRALACLSGRLDALEASLVVGRDAACTTNSRWAQWASWQSNPCLLSEVMLPTAVPAPLPACSRTPWAPAPSARW
jgi:hypothetical protein